MCIRKLHNTHFILRQPNVAQFEKAKWDKQTDGRTRGRKQLAVKTTLLLIWNRWASTKLAPALTAHRLVYSRIVNAWAILIAKVGDWVSSEQPIIFFLFNSANIFATFFTMTFFSAKSSVLKEFIREHRSQIVHFKGNEHSKNENCHTQSSLDQCFFFAN